MPGLSYCVFSVLMKSFPERVSLSPRASYAHFSLHLPVTA